jgi:hypothetical protein
MRAIFRIRVQLMPSLVGATWSGWKVHYHARHLGYVHNEELELFRVGRTVGAGVRRFVENGDSEILEQEQEQTSRQLFNFTCNQT